ncbi:helix-turn-helix domain-containing protein [Rhodoplanes serenus]|uniref:helix-turn-helix domain-containing protein n=1 Tax=Rhodoplanes serenus TaxID=200615 RepID=UPI000DAC4470|nr:transcriptional regulator [Rhodoplanes serenus]RAI35754.1 transcriptional regulator [Rhodoplanes serenus]
MSKLGERLLRSAKQARTIARGEEAPPRAYSPPDVDVALVRRKTGLSQVKFAHRYGFSPASMRDWEQRRRSPDPAARTLLQVIDREPEAVDRALAASARSGSERG